MIRNTIRGATIILATLASAAVILVPSLPALANGDHLCETYGSYCLGSANLNDNTPVYETNPGLSLFLTQQAGSFDGYPLFVMQNNGDVTDCIAGTYSANVFIAACGAASTIWARITTGTNRYRWISVYATQHNPFGYTLYLSGFDQGVNFEVRTLGSPGWFQQFSWH